MTAQRPAQGFGSNSEGRKRREQAADPHAGCTPGVCRTDEQWRTVACTPPAVVPEDLPEVTFRGSDRVWSDVEALADAVLDALISAHDRPGSITMPALALHVAAALTSRAAASQPTEGGALTEAEVQQYGLAPSECSGRLPVVFSPMAVEQIKADAYADGLAAGADIGLLTASLDRRPEAGALTEAQSDAWLDGEGKPWLNLRKHPEGWPGAYDAPSDLTPVWLAARSQRPERSCEVCGVPTAFPRCSFHTVTDIDFTDDAKPQRLEGVTVTEAALAAHREEWASYIENWDMAVGPPPPSAQRIVRALRGPVPFGVAAGDTETGGGA